MRSGILFGSIHHTTVEYPSGARIDIRGALTAHGQPDLVWHHGRHIEDHEVQLVPRAVHVEGCAVTNAFECGIQEPLVNRESARLDSWAVTSGQEKRARDQEPYPL